MSKTQHLMWLRLFYSHHVLYIDENNIFEMNKQARFLRRISYWEFICKGPYTVVDHGPAPSLATVKSRLRKCKYQKYNLISFNCEHFVNYVMTGRVYSTQVQAVFSLCAATLLGELLS